MRKRFGALGVALTLVTAGGLATRAGWRAGRRRVPVRPGAAARALPAHRQPAPAAASVADYALLADVSAVLGSDIDYNRTLDRVASIVVSFLADWCLIELSDDEAALRRVRVAHALRAKSAEAARLEELERDFQHPLVTRAVLDVRESLLMSQVPPRWLTLHARDPEHLEVLKQLGAESLLAVPLMAREECLGALVLVRTDPRRRFTEVSVGFVEEIARRAALALANARLYERAQQAIQVRDEILAVVAHDLRSPLHV